MNLVVDVGNTRVKAACFRNRKLVKLLPEAIALNPLRWPLGIDNLLVCSVKKRANIFRHAIPESTHVVYFNHQTLLPIRNNYHTPRTLGPDRMAAAVGARLLFAKGAVLVIDAGTCITVDLVTAGNAYVGGAILPGISMRLKALHDYTDQLPLVKPTASFKILGRNTRQSIHAGAVGATMLELEAMVRHYRSRYETLSVVATGGDLPLLKAHFKKSIFAAPHLVLIGLNEILLCNPGPRH